MARAGMALRRGGNHGNTENIDDVQRSIELLDRVLSEFDDVENANQVQNIQQISTSVSTPQLREKTQTTTTKSGTETTPDDESPSLGHQSEDDGYMSMNGRKAKFNLAFKPLAEIPVHQNNEEIVRVGDPDDFPPPPEEAQRLIATLLPKVSPSHKPKPPRNFPLTQLPPQRVVLETIPPPHNFSNDYPSLNGLPEPPIHTATQTTLPKTRHQRPYGWESGTDFTLYPPPPPPPGYRFGSLPYYQHTTTTSAYPITSPTRVPPRTVPTVVERHREVKRHGSEENDLDDLRRPLSELADDERFSDDSLEEMLPPPPPPVDKRASIAWEVPLDDGTEELLTPGSTKVIGRRRRSKSGSQSSTGSIPNRLKELDDWPEPPPHGDDGVQSPFSDSDDLQLPVNLSSGTSTYVIRRGRKDRKSIVASSSSINSRLSAADSRLNTPNSRFSVDLTPQHHPHLNSPKSRFSLDLNRTNQELLLSCSDLQSSRSSTPSKKQHSSTYDNIKSLIVESPTIESTMSPIQRVVSLPDVPATTRSRELDVTVEEEEDGEVSSSSSKSVDISPLRQIEQNISELLERRDMEMQQQDERLILNGMAASLNKKKRIRELQKSTSHNEIQKSEEYYRQLLLEGGTPFPAKRNGIQKSESAKEMLIARDSRSIIATSNSVVDFPPLPPSPVEEDEDEYSEIGDEKSAATPAVPPHHHHHHHQQQQNSLKTRSMDANCGRNRRHNYFNRNNVPPERRTLPTDDTSKQQKRTHRYQKRSSSQDIGEIHNMQTSCSLPETPIFARGCDIPRTPHRRAPDVPGGGVQTAPRQSNTVGSLNTLASSSSAATTSGYRRGGGGTGGSFEQAYVGAELLRLAGGPGRGWYPKQRHRRPASIEHLDRMMMASSGGGAHNPWEPSRKPLTLPPNLTPKFFQRSPRDALRRVTSLLIRKGNNGKDVRKEKELVSPTIHENTNGEETQKKKGFFKNLWKRSRHYSLEQQ